MSLPLSKTLDPADFDQLADELLIVGRHFTREREQHPMRRWEYALALRAIGQWIDDGPRPLCDLWAIDVGGAGSPFVHMAVDQHVNACRIIDPAENESLEAYLHRSPILADVVTCLSVIEHVDDLDRFLYHLSCLVAPGGLLFLTIDCCTCPCHDADMEAAGTPDQHHFHWMRKRMFGRYDLTVLAEHLLDYQFSWLGARDFAVRPPTVYDYGFASLALVKRA